MARKKLEIIAEIERAARDGDTNVVKVCGGKLVLISQITEYMISQYPSLLRSGDVPTQIDTSKFLPATSRE